MSETQSENMKRIWKDRLGEGGFVHWNKGKRFRPHSEEELLKMRGRIPWNKGATGLQVSTKHMLGKTHSAITKEKIRLGNLGKHTPKVVLYGKDHPNWRGGTSPLIVAIRGCYKYRQWRSRVFERDTFACQECGDDVGGNLNADHIVPFIFLVKSHGIKSMPAALRCKELWDIDNGRTLCVLCHRKTETYGEYAKQYKPLTAIV